MPSLTVIGLGCRLATDDGVGLVLVERLGATGLALVEALAGTAGEGPLTARLLEGADPLTLAAELLEIAGPVLLVDCADMGLAPGEWRSFAADEVRLGAPAARVSAHGFGVAEALELVAALGRGPEAGVWFFGVQPFDVAPAPGLSDGMSALLPALARALGAEAARLARAAAGPAAGGLAAAGPAAGGPAAAGPVAGGAP